MPLATADPQIERLRQLKRKIEAIQTAPDQPPVSENQATAIANTAREIDAASAAMDDDLFVDAATPTSRLKRLNQIRRGSGLTELLRLPTELESPGFIANLKKEYPKALLKFLESDVAQAIGAGTESTSVGLARAISRGEQPAQPPEGAGFRIMSSIISIMLDPITYPSAGLGGILAKQVSKKVATNVIGRMAARGTTTGTTLAGLTAVRDPLGQQAVTGGIDPLQTVVETGKAGLLGALAGGAGAIGGKVVGTGLEIGTFATGGAALEGRLPNQDDFVQSTGVILGLKTTGMVQRRLGTALFKRSRGEQLTSEEQQTLDQTPQTVKDRILLEARTETPVTTEQMFTKDTLLTRRGAKEFSVLHPDTARVIVDAPNASRKNFGPFKKLLPDISKEMNAGDRELLRGYLHEVAGKPVIEAGEQVAEAGKKVGEAVVPIIKAGKAIGEAGRQIGEAGKPIIEAGKDVAREAEKIKVPLTTKTIRSFFRNATSRDALKESAVLPEIADKKLSELTDAQLRSAQSEAESMFISASRGRSVVGESLSEALLKEQEAREVVIQPYSPLTAEPMPEPGAKLDNLQEAVVKGSQRRATPETPPEAILIVPVEEVVFAKRRGLNPVKKLYRWMRTGGLPEDVVKTRTEADAFVGSVLRQMRFSIDDYNRGIRKAYGVLGRVPEEEMAKINAVLNESASPEILPESVRGPVVKMRSEVDALSTALVREGVVQGEMAAVFTENLGTYLRRTYRIFRTDPNTVLKFWNKLPANERNKAIALFRGELEKSLGRPPTPKESEAYLVSFLHASAKQGSPLGAATSARLGVKELGILKHKKDIPPEIRTLWGKDTNARTQYATTIASQARLLASTKQLRELRDRGLGKFLFEQPQGEFVAKIDDLPGERLYPLTQGKPLYTTIEYEQAMRGAFDPTESNNAFVKGYFWLNAAVKSGKTAGSVMGIQRNFLSNPLIALANGHLNPWRMVQAARITGTDILPSVFNFLKLSNRAQQEMVQKLIKLKVINASSRSGELRAIFKDASKQSGPSGYMENQALRALTLTPRKFFDFFRGGDDFYHTNGFLHELAALRKAYPELQLETLEAKAADKVVRTYPTYSQAPHAIQAMRKAVLVGDFVTFPAEMVRTTINIPRLVAEELANSREQAIGIRRAIGFSAMTATVTGIGVTTRQLVGISQEEEDALRDLAPPWMRNSQWAHFGRISKNKFLTLDTQYNMPQSFMVAPIIAAMRGEDTREATEGAIREMLRPFFNETILFGVARDIAANQRISDNSTGTIYNPESDAVDQTASISAFITSKLQPGTIRSLDRVYKGIREKPLKSGLVPDPGTEILATLLGVRLWTHDVPRSLGFQANTLMDRRRDARRIFFSTAYARGGQDENEIQDAYESAVEAEREIFNRLQHVVHSAKVLGLTNTDVEGVLNDKRVAVPKSDVDRIINGTYDEDGLLSNLVWSLSSREFDERLPRILSTLGVSEDEAIKLLAKEMNERGYETVPFGRLANIRRRIQ